MLNVHACTHVLSVGLIHTSLVLEEEPRDGKATLPCRIHAGTDQRSVTVSVGAVDGHAQDAVSEGGCEVEYLLYLLYILNPQPFILTLNRPVQTATTKRPKSGN